MDKIDNIIQKIKTVLDFLSGKRLSHEAMHLFDLKSSLKNAVKKVSDNGYHLIYSGVHQIFSHPISYTVDKSKCIVNLFTSLPLTKKDQMFKVYHLRDTPLPIKNNTFHLDLSQNTEVLALSHDMEYFKVISLDDMSSDQCQKHGTTKICKNSPISYPRSQLSNFCLGALWNRDFPLVLQHCKMSISHPQPFIREIFKNHFVVYTPTKIDAIQTCYENGIKKVTHITLEGRRELILQDFCEVKSEFFKVTSWMTYTDKMNVSALTYFNWGTGIDELMNPKVFRNLSISGSGKRDLFQELEKAQNVLKNADTLDQIAQSKADIEATKADMEANNTSFHYSLFTGGGGVAILTIATIINITLTCINRRNLNDYRRNLVT